MLLPPGYESSKSPLSMQNTPALQCLKTFPFAGLSPTANFAQQSQRPDRFNMSVPASDLKSGLPESSSASDKPDVDTGAENGTSSNAERSHAYVGSVTSLVSMHAEEQPTRGSGAMQSYASSLFKEGTAEGADSAQRDAGGGPTNTTAAGTSGGTGGDAGQVCCMLCMLCEAKSHPAPAADLVFSSLSAHWPLILH